MTDQTMFQIIADELKINFVQVKNTVELLDDGNTVPFIARYRKEVTGSADEVEIRNIEERINYLRALETRKESILNSIEEQGKLTPELKTKIEKCSKMQELEDLYLPYKPKKRTKATIAKEKGLQPLAELILAQEETNGIPEDFAREYINEEKEVSSAEDALQGARDIIAEIISEDADVRKSVRELTFAQGILRSDVKKVEGRTDFEAYYEYSEAISKIVPHRILAINRGESESVLKVNVDVDSEKMNVEIAAVYIKNKNSIFFEQMQLAVADSYNRLIAPSISREVRSSLSEKADAHAIEIFATNLKNLLLQPPVRGKKIMGIDPGFRTGSKVAVIDTTGKYIEGTTIYPHPPQNKYMEAKGIVRKMVEKYDIDIIAIGNGTASRETEQMAAELIGEIKTDHKVEYIIVSEAGASVYSASKVAREEFPDLDASMRGNISIARRLLDPLAELVKIDPKSIGVGLYQHDVNQRRLVEALGHVVESCVNSVGVNLNTASASLLKHISGLTSRTAQNIISHRDSNGIFKNRNDLKKVDGIGEIAFEQAAGFLRIPDGNEALDNTSIHPESYLATAKLMENFGIKDIAQDGKSLPAKVKESQKELENLLQDLGIGRPTFDDILENLAKPGLDPRDELQKPIFKSDVLKMEDIKEGMMLKGTVRNVVDFGAFVDIGVKQDGLVHVSQMADKFVKNPMEIVSVGDVVDVRVTSIDLERGRIGLSMKKG
ncbi:MAG: RNA-binding transcriptional accessory protein [Calditrichaeota bacterium]|nr:MAG: RNA-binding transcriptional accessory protein [Calditrichota bacterium]MBL1204872.1 RNA-binding transcriptional accessory protein [Calditrichota bacterium]NOG44701.1 RNA-binding transcriptional accessory protein [Calditrichota bacterium]